MNISIFASIGCQNLGDELILKNEIQLLRARYGNSTNFRVFTYDVDSPFFTDDHIKYLEYFPVGSKDPKNIWRNFRNYKNFLITLLWSDIVVIGGGGLLYENEVQTTRSPLDLWEYRVKWMRRLRKKILFFAIGIDIHSSEGKQKLKRICGRRNTEVTVRDMESFFTLHEVGIESSVVDDPVFSDTSSMSTGRILGMFDSRSFSPKDIGKITFRGKRVGIALRSGYIGNVRNQKLEVLMIEELLREIETRGGQITLLPHSFHRSDAVANDYEFLKQFEKSDRILLETMQEVYQIYTNHEIDICVGMRLHSMILAYRYGIDLVALSYIQKTDEAIKKISK